MLLAFVRVASYYARGRRFRRRFLDALLVRYFGWRPLFNGARYVVLCSIVLTVYSSIKQAIPMINPQRNDDAYISIERSVHFCVNPSRALEQSNAQTWWFLVHRNRAKRDRYFAAFMAAWLVADVIGVLTPSHGPCYVDPEVFPPAPMYLCRMTQDWLWLHYVSLEEITLLGNGNMEFGCGLMAMPSLHVVVVGLYVIFLWNEKRWMRYVSAAYAALIIIGSVYSGWHYAIDGYAGLLIAILITWGVGKLPGAYRRPSQSLLSP